jgi:hypothetical protein
MAEDFDQSRQHRPKDPAVSRSEPPPGGSTSRSSADSSTRPPPHPIRRSGTPVAPGLGLSQRYDREHDELSSRQLREDRTVNGGSRVLPCMWGPTSSTTFFGPPRHSGRKDPSPAFIPIFRLCRLGFSWCSVCLVVGALRRRVARPAGRRPPTVICSEGQPSCTAAAGVHRARDPLALRIAPTLPLRRESSNENGTSFADRLAQPGKDVSPTAAHPFWRSLGHWV